LSQRQTVMVKCAGRWEVGNYFIVGKRPNLILKKKKKNKNLTLERTMSFRGLTNTVSQKTFTLKEGTSITRNFLFHV